ncbi:HCaRG [Carpediemonas membranifera]|uniref:HCaRG n=1 Tax=Carpediemonas membranifera TaxID=201153 RepID=A0A8J6E1C3_9EUKA|nr:HCaRG [Carpediemonas membranifera]|eukprot:KAG9393293.1 HCaRG [Carpediemonas membranifera]
MRILARHLVKTMDFSALLPLQEAPPKFINKLVQYAFRFRDEAKLPTDKLEPVASSLSLDPKSAIALFKSLVVFVKAAMFDFTPEKAASFFKPEFPQDLRDVLVAAVGHNMAAFKASVSENSLTLPKYAGLDWEVQVKTTANATSTLRIPTVQAKLATTDATGKENFISFEMDATVLQTVTEEMQRVKTQLDAVVQE